MTALDLPPRERAADAAPLQPIRPCRLRQPESLYPSPAEVVLDRVTLGIVAAFALMFIGQYLRTWL